MTVLLQSFCLLLCTNVAIAASVSYTMELREWVVDYRRPTILPRQTPYSIAIPTKMEAVLANNSFPGPSIEAYEGDEVVVSIVNQLLDKYTDLVWEGVDVTQAPKHAIRQQGGNFTYRMLAPKAGTYWWHARVVNQVAKGLRGSLVVRSRKDPFASLYQEEQMMVLSDAMQRPEVCLTKTGALIGGCPEIDTVLLNGQWGDDSSALPLPVISVQKGRCYRLRFLGMMIQPSHFEVSIQDHSMRTLGTNVSQPTSSIQIPKDAGVDAVLCADQNPVVFKDYSITVTYVGLNLTKSASAVLRYTADLHV